MRSNLFIAFFLFVFEGILSAQAPEAIQYQAVARDVAGNPLLNKNISVKFNVRSGGVEGTIVYSERHNTYSNSFGLVNLQLGKGEILTGFFPSIQWESGTFYLETLIDAQGGTNYQVLGTTQLVSVPFALYAKTAGNTVNGDGDSDPQNEIQSLIVNGHNLSLSKGNTIVLPDDVNDADADPQNELQMITQNGNTVTLSKGGGSITLSADNDSDPANEIQTLTQTGNTISLSKGGGSVTINPNDADADPQNEIQTLSINGNQLSLSKGNSVTLPGGGTDKQWTEAGLDIYYNKGRVSVGTDISNGDFTIKGNQEFLTPANFARMGLGTYLDNSSFISLLGAQGSPSVTLETDVTYPDRGLISLWKESNKEMIELGSGSKGGYIDFYNNNGKLTNLIAYDNATNPSGFFSTYTATGKQQAYLGSHNGSTPSGLILALNPNEDPNVALSNLNNYPYNGLMAIQSNGNDVAGAYADQSGFGILWGDIKSFRMKYPGRAGQEIWYASLEGPEAAAYTRGTAKLNDGEVFVEFPEHYQVVANPESMTVIVTPLSADSKGMAVIEKTGKGIRVKELAGGKGNYSFDWEVKCVRSGHENFRVIRSSDELQYPKLTKNTEIPTLAKQPNKSR